MYFYCTIRFNVWHHSIYYLLLFKLPFTVNGFSPSGLSYKAKNDYCWKITSFQRTHLTFWGICLLSWWELEVNFKKCSLFFFFFKLEKQKQKSRNAQVTKYLWQYVLCPQCRFFWKRYIYYIKSAKKVTNDIYVLSYKQHISILCWLNA